MMDTDAEMTKPPRRELCEFWYCRCRWYGTLDEMDATGSEQGCCPRCGNEDLDILSDIIDKQAIEIAELKSTIQFVLKEQAEQIRAKDEAWCQIDTLLKTVDHRIGHVYSAHPLSKHVCGDLDVAFADIKKMKGIIQQALKGKS